MIEIKNLTKKYSNNIKAVDNLSFNINNGELFGFIGHNGAGKTTTIKSIVGILNFDEGEILIEGKSIKKKPNECKQMISYLPDNPDLYETLTGIQYLNFICDMYSMPRKTRKENIEKYAKLFDLYDSLGDIISSYSHGMKQKLALISAFIHEPKIIVLDEPFVGLDPKASYTLKTLMRKFCDNGGIIFFSTHVLEVAEKICDKIAIIKNGKLIKIGSVSEIKGDNSLESVFLELTERM